MKLNRYSKTKSIIDQSKQEEQKHPEHVRDSQEFLKRLAIECIYQRNEGRYAKSK